MKRFARFASFTQLSLSGVVSVVLLSVCFSAACAAQDGFLTFPSATLLHPVQGWYYNDGLKYHGGIDILEEPGSNILAAAGGLAISSCQFPVVADPQHPDHLSFGQFVLIDHQNGYSTLYAHLASVALPIDSQLPCDGQSQHQILSSSSPIVYKGVTFNWAPVNRGDVIGLVGNTGTFVPHIHFEVAIDPNGSYLTHAAGSGLTNRLDPFGIFNSAEFYPPPEGNCTNVPTQAKYLWTSCPPVPPINGSPLLGTDLPTTLANGAELSVASFAFLAQSFTVNTPIRVTAINLQMSGFGTDKFTVWLTNSVGSATTASNVLFQADLTFPSTGGGISGKTVTAVTGLTLPPGIYFIVLSSNQSQASQGWLSANSVLPTTIGEVAQDGVLVTALQGGTTNLGFPPSSTFVKFPIIPFMAFQIMGEQIPIPLASAIPSTRLNSAQNQVSKDF